jgi:putative transposase
MQMTDAGDELGTTPSVEPVPARRVVDELIEAGVFDELLERIDERGLQLTGEGGFLPEMIKAVLERGLQAELTDHLGYERGDRAGWGSPNSRNGSTPKTVATEVGDVGLAARAARIESVTPG